MTRKSFETPARSDQRPPAEPARKSVVFIVIALAVVMTACAWYFFRRPALTQQQVSSSNSDSAAARESTPTPPAGDQSKLAFGGQNISVEPGDVSPASNVPAGLENRKPVTVPESPPRPPRPEPSAYTRALLGNLSGLDLSRGTITPEQAEFWKQEYGKLVKEGAQAVPAIREFLERNVDAKFASVENGEQLGAPSLRFAMLDALRQIGGPEAISLAVEVMQTTVRPDEIALLARNLDAMAPDEYRDAAVAAARAALAKTAANPAAIDSSPLFEVLQTFGGANALPDLEQASTKWNYYAPIVLASMPDGVGIPSLARLAQNPDGAFESSSQFALRMLAELAPQYPDAAQALLDQIGRNKVPNAAWLGIASALGGEQNYYGQGYLNTVAPPANATEPKTYHIKANNQNFGSMNVSPTWTPEQLQRQLALIDQFRAANPTAGRILEGVRNTLSAKLNQ